MFAFIILITFARYKKVCHVINKQIEPRNRSFTGWVSKTCDIFILDLGILIFDLIT